MNRPHKLVKTQLRAGLTRLQAVMERNRLIREGKAARISKANDGYRVIVKEHVFGQH